MTLKEKINYIKEFKDKFGNKSLSFNDIVIISNLSIDEIIDGDFEDKLLPLIKDGYSDLSKEKRILSLMMDGHFLRLFENLSENDQDKLLEKVINTVKVYNNDDNYYIERLMSKIINITEKIDSSKILMKIIKMEAFDSFISDSNFLEVSANKIMTTGTIEKIMKIYDVFSKYPNVNYANFPLAILNKNITNEQKIEIIKKTYKQKDIHKYTSIIRENLNDLNDLDSFIEATITQNNRVKEKEKNIFELLRRIFFGIRGENYYSSDVDYSKFINKKSFIDKYKSSISLKSVEDIIENAPWRMRKNIVKFFREMYSEQPFEDKITIAAVDREIGQSFFSDSSSMPSDIIGNEEKEKLFLKYMLKNNRLSSLIEEQYDAFLNYINKYPELFKESFSSISLSRVFSKSRGYYYGSNSDDNIKILNELDLKVYDHLDLIDIKILKDFGFSDDGENNYNSSYVISERVEKFFKKFLRNLKEVLKNSKNNIKDVLYSKYFYNFEDEDFTSEILSEISKVISDGKVMERVRENFSSTRITTNDAMISYLLDSFISVFKEFYSEKELLLKNLDKLKNELAFITSL